MNARYLGIHVVNATPAKRVRKAPPLASVALAAVLVTGMLLAAQIVSAS